jgi:cyclopropane-fatty-acyl-phospholipid synthase
LVQETAMDRWVRRILSKFVRRGTLTVSIGQGHEFTVGDGTGSPIEIHIENYRAFAAIIAHPELKLGEAYMDGRLRMVRGGIADLLDLILSQTHHEYPLLFEKMVEWAQYLVRRFNQFNPRGRSRKNVAHHYDLDGRLYSLFLDSDRQYSCAYFEKPGQNLNDAQVAKKRHLAAKLLLDGPGLSILDIGSGWGGLGIYLAEVAGAKVTGVTLSEEQFATSRMRVAEKKLGSRVDFRLEDYRDVRGTFDRIVSVGMFEHVGVNHYDQYFRRVADLLKDDGVALVHSIGRFNPPTTTSSWIKKYIFPGGYIPALSEVFPAIQRSGLVVTDVEILRLHYAETLKTWRERFIAHREEIERLYDHRFFLMFEFYLAASEMSFRHRGLMIFQLQLAKRQDAVPLTRDYIGPAEDKLRHAERKRRAPLRLAGE